MPCPAHMYGASCSHAIIAMHALILQLRSMHVSSHAYQENINCQHNVSVHSPCSCSILFARLFLSDAIQPLMENFGASHDWYDSRAPHDHTCIWRLPHDSCCILACNYCMSLYHHVCTVRQGYWVWIKSSCHVKQPSQSVIRRSDTEKP